MTEQFYTILTSIGKAKIANAGALGEEIEFKEFALGDGGGDYYNPNEVQERLNNEVWRGPIGRIAIDEKNSNWIVIETVIPASIGGFMIREAGIFDNEGNLIAIGKYPETYKPSVESGSAKDLIIKMILEVSNTSVVTLKIDPTIILATKKDIDVLSNRITKNENDILELKEGSTEIEDLKTENKTLAGAINEVKEYTDTTKEGLEEEIENLENKLGRLDELDTEEKDDLVKAINELVGKKANKSDLEEIELTADKIELDSDNFDSNNVKGGMDELFQSVSDGKQVIATAITDKGVETSSSDTFSKMAGNIKDIDTDPSEDATATSGDIAKGKSAYVKGEKVIGDLELTGNALLSHVLAGNTFYNDNLKVKRTGTMPNRGTVLHTLTSQGGQYNIAEGYYSGGSIKAQFANLTSSNIKDGVNIGGVIGSFTPSLEDLMPDSGRIRTTNYQYHGPSIGTRAGTNKTYLILIGRADSDVSNFIMALVNFNVAMHDQEPVYDILRVYETPRATIEEYSFAFEMGTISWNTYLRKNGSNNHFLYMEI